MINNDVLRRLRYALSLKDPEVIALFALNRVTVSADELAGYLKHEDEDGFVELPDTALDAFLDGLITSRRGAREGAPPPKPARLSNNLILRKLRIALELREEDMLDLFALANFRISRGELSAFFRQPGHKNYRPCGDQVVRNFLQGLAKRRG